MLAGAVDTCWREVCEVMMQSLSTLSNGILQCSQKGIKLKCWLSTIGQHVVVDLMNNAFCFVRVRLYESFALAGFKDLHCIQV